MSAFTWIVTWIIFLAVFIALASTRWGKPLVYYALWTLVLLLVVTRGKELAATVNVNALQLNG